MSARRHAVVAVVFGAAACRGSAAPAEPPREAPRMPRLVQLGGDAGGTIEGHDVAVLPSGNLVVSTCAWGDVDLGGETVEHVVERELMLVSYRPEGGAPRWTAPVEGECYPGYPSQIATDLTGHIFLVTAGVNHAPVMVRLDDGGAEVWRASLVDGDFVYGIVADGSGGVLVAGIRTKYGGARGFVTALDDDGGVRWDRELTGSPFLYVTDVAIAGDTVAIAGNYDHELQTDGAERKTDAGAALFVAELALADGTLGALADFDAPYVYIGGERIEVDFATDGGLVVSGTFSGDPGGIGELGWGVASMARSDEIGPYFLFALRVDPRDETVAWARVWTGANVFAHVVDQLVWADQLTLTIELGPWEQPAVDIDFGAGSWSNPRGVDLVGVTVEAAGGTDVRADRLRGASELEGGRIAAAADGTVFVVGTFTEQLVAGESHLRAHTEVIDPCKGGGSPFLLGIPPPDPCRKETQETRAGFLGRLFP